MTNILTKYAEQTVLRIKPSNGNVKDLSQGGNDGTIVGTPTIRVGVGASNFSTSNYIEVGDVSDLKFTNEDWTIGFRVSNPYDKNVLPFGKGTSASVSPYLFQLDHPSDDVIGVYIGRSDAGAWLCDPNDLSGAYNPDEMNWVVLTKSGAILSLYIQGVLKNTFTMSSDTILDNTSNFRIGTSSGATQPLIEGGIVSDTFVISGVALTGQENSELYQQLLQEPVVTHIIERNVLPEITTNVASSNLKLSYGMFPSSNKMIDLSGNGNNSASLENVVFTPGFYGQAASYSSEFPTFQTASALDLSSTQQVSVEFMIKPGSIATTQQLLEISADQNAQTDSFSVFLSASKLSCALTTAGGGTDRNSTTTLEDNKWAHVVVVFDKTVSGNDMVEIYVNSVEESAAGGAAAGTSGGNFANRVFYIGARGGTSLICKSTIDHVKVYDTKLTQAQIDLAYAQVGKKVFYHQTGQDWEVSSGNVTGGFLENTGFTVSTGTWQVDDGTGNAKVLHCIADGKLTLPLANASELATTTFELVSGSPTLTKNANSIEIDAVAGEKVGVILLQ